jgi:hypothetical protein
MGVVGLHRTEFYPILQSQLMAVRKILGKIGSFLFGSGRKEIGGVAVRFQRVGRKAERKN